MAKPAAAARSSGGDSLAFGRRKEKREWASSWLKGGCVSLGWLAGQGLGRGKTAQEDGRGERADLEGKEIKVLSLQIKGFKYFQTKFELHSN
jgi:hypothetical protein